MPKPDKKGEKDSKKPQKDGNVDPSGSGIDAKPKLPFDITKIDPEKIRMAEEMGIPIGKMLQWIVHTEQRLDIIIKNMPNQKQIEKAMNDALINIARQQSTGQPTKTGEDQAQGGQRSGSMIEQILMKALLGGGGGGQDEEMLKIQKEIMQMSLSRMKSDISFTDEIKKAIVVNIASKAAKNVID